MAFEFTLLNKEHQREAFDCGVEALNQYLKKFARKDAERKVAATFVLVDSAKPEMILGYYTLSAFTVFLSELPVAMQKKLPYYPNLPATLIGRLARSIDAPGTGKLLLVDALLRSLRQSEQIASLAVVVDAKDEMAETFYQRYGFQKLGDEPKRMYLPMKTVKSLLLGD